MLPLLAEFGGFFQLKKSSGLVMFFGPFGGGGGVQQDTIRINIRTS
jgi:hypothetical protein